MWPFFFIREDLWSREKLAGWALQEKTLLVSLFKCLKWIFRSAFPYTLNPPTLSQNYASRGIFRYHLPLTLWWKQGPLKVRCIRAVPLCSMSISKGPSMIWVWLAPQSCIRYFTLECFLERVSCSLPLFSGVWLWNNFSNRCPLLKWKGPQQHVDSAAYSPAKSSRRSCKPGCCDNCFLKADNSKPCYAEVWSPLWCPWLEEQFVASK